MHTYTPTASHDPVVEFDNGDLGNQTNLNNVVRALGNRSQLAKQVNDVQDITLADLQTKMLLAYDPATLTARLSLSANAASGAYAGGAERFTMTTPMSKYGNDVATGLDFATFTGTGGGTKIIRLGPNSRYLVTVMIMANTPLTGPGTESGAPDSTDLGAVTLEQADDTALSVNVSASDLYARAMVPNPIEVVLPYSSLYWQFNYTVQLVNTGAAPRYFGLKWAAPVADGTVTVSSTRSRLVIHRLGTA